MDISSLRERQTGGAVTVSELNTIIKNIFDNTKVLSSVTVRGEISNFVNHRSGHFYFTLKDQDSQIRAVMFRSSTYNLKFAPESGMKVIVHGSVTVYPRDGSYQIYVTNMQPDGIGALYLAYEQLKEKLSAEGLFDERHKKLIPRYPEKIGVITSPTGAAVRDIINVTGRRYPMAKLYLYPSLVQGVGAEENLVRAVDYFDKSKLVDVIIIGRGGGSIEDLWAFNSEKLARRIYDTKIPVISAVGHETDFTICDFVSDLRAPTPSAAAELSVPDTRELLMKLDSCQDRITNALIRKADTCRERLENIVSCDVIKQPNLYFSDKHDELNTLVKDLNIALKDSLSKAENRFSIIAEKLYALNPLSVLARGFSLLEKNGNTVSSNNDLTVGDTVRIRLKDGEAKAQITEVLK